MFLSNRVHPDGKGDVTPLRARVATVAAAALLTPEDIAVNGRSAKAFALRASADAAADVARRLQPSDLAVDVARRLQPSDHAQHDPTLAGIDVLAAENFARLRGKKVGLLTNQTGRSRTGESTIDLLAHAPDVTLVALFSP